MLDKLADFFVDSRRNGDIVLSSGLVQDRRDLDRREEVFAEVSAFLVRPGESGFLEAHKVVHEHAFFGE